MIKYIHKPGTLLEGYMNSVCSMLNAMGFHAHKNQPERTYGGKYLAGEPFDYEFFIRGRVYCFDAKENFSGSTKWKLHYSGNRGRAINARLLRQAENLACCQLNGAEAFFLVAFDDKRLNLPYALVRYEAKQVYEGLCSGKRFMEFKEGTRFDINDIIGA